ncbi:alpha/beta-hydrolase [Gloeophyllum trabeum ATCC 11539]|uniref:Carboxypeptidase n=1 Tax=Gloeophyllum trabeum (strain ATCC 11539 / FP-39264 / Madison 617) TaxID=670483 RepID=S7RVF8_GLOTA|nr:alpha/beta-hydrolase [Gloeophyllum trabeum ATCC 11539]EPQ57234.1 alpha/beta-hydrolase [Gloeophyllum trabeum ATCC 11539]
MLELGAIVLGLAALAAGQDTPPSTYPHNYTGIPSTAYGPDWQSYFEVTEPLPNVTVTLSRNWAGSLSVNRAGHPNDTLFFWGFEKENGSLTAQAGEKSDEPWLIWLNGGPGASSFLGFMGENGPLHVTNTYSIVPNNYSWDKLIDSIWVDQPVGTGYSTADATGYIADEDQMGQDFLGFLTNLVAVFPSLAERPLYLTGESYAGTYIPYITKAIFSSPNPPVKLAKFAIGDGATASLSVFEMLPMLSVIETYPQLISYDPDVYDYFKTQTHLCGYDLNLSYPETAPFPTLPLQWGTIINGSVVMDRKRNKFSKSAFKNGLATKIKQQGELLTARDLETREERRQSWKRDLLRRSNDTLDPYYGCDLLDHVIDYVLNYTFPWKGNDYNGFDVYFVPDALDPEAPLDPSVFLNDNQTRAALHAPTSKDWVLEFDYPFGSTYNYTFPGGGTNEFGDPSVEPMAFLSELAQNATKNNVSMIFYSGNADLLVGHRGTEVTIQNTTWGGIQGFTRKPSTPWYDDDGNFAGIVHQERNLTYVLFVGAGHEVPEYEPAAAWVFLREFILGSNTTGLVTTSGNGTVTVVGGESSVLAEDVLPAASDPIYYGPGTTVSSYIPSSATVAAWESFIATATATVTTVESSVVASPVVASSAVASSAVATPSVF